MTALALADFVVNSSEYEVVQTEISPCITTPTLKCKRGEHEHRLLNDSELTLVKAVIRFDRQAKEFKAMADASFKRLVQMEQAVDDLKAQLTAVKNLHKL